MVNVNHWQSIQISLSILPACMPLSLTFWGNVNYYGSVHRLILTRGDPEHPGNCQNKSVSSPFN